MNSSYFSVSCPEWERESPTIKVRALLALLAFSFPQMPLPARATDTPPPETAHRAFEEGMRLYEALDYEQAIRSFQEALQGNALTREQCIHACTRMGVMYVGMNREEEAVAPFLALLAIDPDVTLDYGLRSPKVMEALRQAREIYIREKKATDTAAPVIQASPLEGKAAFGRRLDFTFRISDATRIVQPQVFFRKKGDLTYEFLPLQSQGGDVYFASIPSNAMTGEALEYYLVAIDEAGNATIEGSAGMPFSIPVAPDPQVRAWYKKWWVWTLVAVAAGGAATAGVLLSSGEDTPASNNTGTATITFGP